MLSLFFLNIFSRVTREHREALAKNAKSLSEKSKKQLRDTFSRCSKKIKGAKMGHSADDLKAAVSMVSGPFAQVI